MAIGPYDRDGAPERGEPSLRRDDTKRDAPERGDALRATPFTDEVFADRDDGAARSSGTSVSLIVGVVLGVVLVGGVGWYAFQNPAGVALAPGETQTIKADTTPYKMRPDNPGGMQVENQDKLVYDRVAKGAAPNRVESLLPPPEEPKAPPKAPPKEVAAAPPPVAPSAEKMPEKVAEKAPAKAPEKTMESIVKAANEDPSRAVASTAPAAPAPSSDAASLAAAVAAATTAKPSAVEVPKAPEPKTAVQTAAVTPAVTAPTVMPAGSFQIQLVSVPTEDAAQSEWKRISGRHKDLFAALAPAITPADLGEKGIYYRLRAGPLADKAAADQLCATLAADKVGCIVIKP